MTCSDLLAHVEEKREKIESNSNRIRNLIFSQMLFKTILQQFKVIEHFEGLHYIIDWK
jgi:hypothetical protein